MISTTNEQSTLQCPVQYRTESKYDDPIHSEAQAAGKQQLQHYSRSTEISKRKYNRMHSITFIAHTDSPIS